jgi:hypothetical protein
MLEPETPTSQEVVPETGSRQENSAEGEAAIKNESITWRVRLSDNEPWKRWVVFGVAVLVFLIGVMVYRRPLLGIIGSVMILAATAEFWLGTVYKLDEEGASSRTGLSMTRILWKDVKRAVVTPVGIKLSPLDEATRMAPFRGVFLRFGREDRVRIEQAVRTMGGKDVRFVEGTAD